MAHRSDSHTTSRRGFLGTAAAAGSAPLWLPTTLRADDPAETPAEDRLKLGCIGTGSRWRAVGRNAMQFADCVALCDVDKDYLAKAHGQTNGWQNGRVKPEDVALYEDYQKILERDDIDVVTIVTPDHWHTKIAVEAMQAGKDVYCEKPLTLTIEEGKQIRKVQEETGRVFQVGTQQRSEMGLRFLQAVAIARSGRLGKIQAVQCAIGGSKKSGPLETMDPPPNLNWERWLGQAPLVDYIPRRCHYEFRWWYEYSGGKMTDWGAHHVDIAQWAIGMENSGPTYITPIEETHPVPFENGYPTVDNEYNAATAFKVRVDFPNDVVMLIRNDTANGVRIKGEDGEIFVSRGQLTGDAVDALKENPLPEELLVELYNGKKPGGGNAHMRNFFECVADRGTPVSDVRTHHRSMTTCHLANIAIRLKRELRWDPETEQIVGDDEAKKWQAREQREGYEINVSV